MTLWDLPHKPYADTACAPNVIKRICDGGRRLHGGQLRKVNIYIVDGCDQVVIGLLIHTLRGRTIALGIGTLISAPYGCDDDGCNKHRGNHKTKQNLCEL